MVRINILLKDGPKCSVGCNQNVKRLSGRRKHLPRAEYSTRRMAHPTYKSDTSSEFPEISQAARASIPRCGAGLLLVYGRRTPSGSIVIRSFAPCGIALGTAYAGRKR